MLSVGPECQHGALERCVEQPPHSAFLVHPRHLLAVTGSQPALQCPARSSAVYAQCKARVSATSPGQVVSAWACASVCWQASLCFEAGCTTSAVACFVRVLQLHMCGCSIM